MKQQELDSVLITSVPNIIYITDYNGFSPIEREAYMLITKTDAFLIVSALHIVEVKKLAKNVTVLERTYQKPFKKILSEKVKKYKIKTCGFESENLTYYEYNALASCFPKFVPSDLSNLRLLKTAKEIAVIERASKLGDEAYSYILKHLKLGMTEKEIVLELEWFTRKAGHDISFPPVVAFEEYAAIPHHNASEIKLKKNDLILLDFGTKVDNYCSDMTRVCVFGKASAEKRKVYQTVVDAQQKAIDYIKNCLDKENKPISTTVDATARDYITSKGYPPFNHSSHGIGLEVHENPHVSSSKDPLENGVVFSIEPGIYLPGNMGVRIEDLFTIQNNKLLPLTHSSKDLIEI